MQFTNRHYGSRAKGEPISVLITERDTDDPFMATGAIVFEQYTNISQEEVISRAESLSRGGRYGRVWLADLTNIREVPVDELASYKEE